MGADVSTAGDQTWSPCLWPFLTGDRGDQLLRMEDSGVQGLGGHRELRHRTCVTCSAHDLSHGPGQSPVMSTGTWATQFGVLGSPSHRSASKKT